MKLAGEATLHGSVEQVYAALNDPAVLVRTIPGCERLEQTGPDAYTMAVTAGVAAVKGRYTGEVVLADQRAPHEFVLRASGSGAPGTVSARARIRLSPGLDGMTTVAYDADAVVGGMVGGVGQRVLTGVARRTADEFFAAVDEVLTGPVPAEVGVGPEGRVGAEGGVGAEVPTVFTRPARAGVGLPGRDFAAGVVFGALAALLGAIVGGALARRSRKG
jgi:carbon monoxide dehydrogenase subunit G